MFKLKKNNEKRAITPRPVIRFTSKIISRWVIRFTLKLQAR
jgi:hypothetical protein